MLVVALDACAIVHAKGLPATAGGGLSGLVLFDELVGAGAKLTTTTGVHAEQVTMSLLTTLEQRKQNGVLRVVPVPGLTVKALDNRIGKKVARPGRRDIALVQATIAQAAVLLTHDTGAARYARAAGVTTIDLIDVGLFLAHLGKLTIAELEALFAPFNVPGSFQSDDWNGSMASTMMARPHSQALCVELERRLHRQP